MIFEGKLEGYGNSKLYKILNGNVRVFNNFHNELKAASC